MAGDGPPDVTNTGAPGFSTTGAPGVTTIGAPGVTTTGVLGVTTTGAPAHPNSDIAVNSVEERKLDLMPLTETSERADLSHSIEQEDKDATPVVTTSVMCANDDCEDSNASFLCSGCKKVRYCSGRCQRTHWVATQGHREYCQSQRNSNSDCGSGAGERKLTYDQRVNLRSFRDMLHFWDIHELPSVPGFLGASGRWAHIFGRNATLFPLHIAPTAEKRRASQQCFVDRYRQHVPSKMPGFFQNTLSEEVMRRAARTACIDIDLLTPETFLMIREKWLARLIRVILTTIAIGESDWRKSFNRQDVYNAVSFLQQQQRRASHYWEAVGSELEDPGSTVGMVIEEYPSVTDSDDSDYDLGADEGHGEFKSEYTSESDEPTTDSDNDSVEESDSEALDNDELVNDELPETTSDSTHCTADPAAGDTTSTGATAVDTTAVAVEAGTQ